MRIDAEPYEFNCDPRSVALLIIDMQRDFLEPGGFGAMRTFSGLNATHTASPGFASSGESARSRPAAALTTTVPEAPTSITRPSTRLTSPMKSATQREFGRS